MTNLAQRIIQLIDQIKQEMSGWENFMMDHNYQDQSSIQLHYQSGEEDDQSVQNQYGQIFQAAGSPLKIGKKGYEKLAFFHQIIWLIPNQEQEREKMRTKIYTDNLQIIYGTKVKKFNLFEEVSEHLDKKKKKTDDIEQMLRQDRRSYKFIYTSLVICTNKTFQTFSHKLALMSHVYTKCITFRLECSQQNVVGKFVYQNVRQIYDIIDVVKKIQKQCISKAQASYYELFKEFNIWLNSFQLFQLSQDQFKEEKVINEENIVKEENKQEQKLQEDKYQKKINSNNNPQVCKLRQIIDFDLCKQLLEMQHYIPLDLTEVNFIIITTATVKQRLSEYQSEIFIVRTYKQLDDIISQEKCPKIILLSTNLQNCFQIMDDCKDVVHWIRCSWGRDQLEDQDLDMYDQKYGCASDVHPSYTERVVNVDDLQMLKAQIDRISAEIESMIY